LDRVKSQTTVANDKIDKLQETVESALKPHTSPRPRKDMPVPQQIFHGRDEFVNEIIALFTSQPTSRVCITAVGGMGKTSVTLAVAAGIVKKTVDGVEHGIFDSNYVFWVPCIEAPTADLFRKTLYAQLRITAESYDSLDPLIRELCVSKEPRLILLDNFETTWLSSDEAEVRDILYRIVSLPHIALLVSMTSGHPPDVDGIEWDHRPLSPLTPSPARDVFKRKYLAAVQKGKRGADDTGIDLDTPELDELLDCLGYLPLAVTLMAAFGGRLQTSPADLLQQWRESGTEIISRGSAANMDRTIGFSMSRGICQSDPKALTLLAILSMLPAGTTGKNLHWWAPNLASHCDTLVTAALIERGDGPFESSTIFVRPTIQAYMAHDERISTNVREQVYAACYQFVLDHGTVDPDKPNFKRDIAALRGEQTNIQDLLMQVKADGIVVNALDALITFGLFQSGTKPSTLVASHAVEIARILHNTPSGANDTAAARRIAEAHMCLGKNLFSLDCYDEAASQFEVAGRCFRELAAGAGGDLHNAGECGMSQALAWMFNIGNKSDDELESIVAQAQADLSHDPTDNYHVARGLLGHGAYLWWTVSIAAIPELSAASNMFVQLKCPASAAACLQHAARAHSYLGAYSEALELCQKALFAATESGDDSLICAISEETSQYLIRCKRYHEAADLLEDTLSLSRAVGLPVTIAQTLELIGFNNAHQMNLSVARNAYRLAAEQFEKFRDQGWGSSADRCVSNANKLGDYGGVSALQLPSYMN
jgi:tetratricopeptide (TPR) repeat protein